MAPIKAEATSGAPRRLATSCDAPTAWWNWASCCAAIWSSASASALAIAAAFLMSCVDAGPSLSVPNPLS